MSPNAYYNYKKNNKEVKNTTKLTISFDPNRPLDVYDRILGEVHPGADSSSESLNKKMVKSEKASEGKTIEIFKD